MAANQFFNQRQGADKDGVETSHCTVSITVDGSQDNSTPRQPVNVSLIQNLDFMSDTDPVQREHWRDENRIGCGMEKNKYSEKLPGHLVLKQEDVLTVPTYLIDKRMIVILPNAYQAVLKTWGSCSDVQSLLTKQGIETCLCTPSELRKLKRIKAVDWNVKLCSYISKDDFFHILHKYDEMYNTCNNSTNIHMSPPVDLSDSENLQNIGEGKTLVSSVDMHDQTVELSSFSFRVYVFCKGKQDFVHLSEVKSMFDAYFERPELFAPFMESLKIAREEFTAIELGRIGVDFEGDKASQGLYITTKDVDRIMQFTSVFLDVDPPEILWARKVTVKLSDAHEERGISKQTTETTQLLTNAESLPPVITSILSSCVGDVAMPACVDSRNNAATAEDSRNNAAAAEDSRNNGATAEDSRNNAAAAEDSCNNGATAEDSRNNAAAAEDGRNNAAAAEDETKECHAASYQEESPVPACGFYDASCSSPLPRTNSLPLSEAETSSSLRCIVRTCQLNGNVVVCIPDIHKIVIELYGQCVQVGYYMQRLSIPKYRFTTSLLKCLKAHKILSSKATVCTYITRTDAERLLKMYDACNATTKLQSIQWGEPIILENVLRETSTNKLSGTIEDDAVHQVDVVKIQTFIINQEVVVSMPDVHKVVQLLNGQSVQLRYNLEKLGIVKHKYSHSQVYRLKAVSDLKRPSMCTFITKTDVDRLLQFYATGENKSRLRLVEWQAPIILGDSDENSVALNVDGSVSVSRPEVMYSESVTSADDVDENVNGGQMSGDYSISDLYKAFVGDDVESINNSVTGDDENRKCKSSSLSLSPMSSSSSPVVSLVGQRDKITQCATARTDSTREQQHGLTTPASRVLSNTYGKNVNQPTLTVNQRRSSPQTGVHRTQVGVQSPPLGVPNAQVGVSNMEVGVHNTEVGVRSAEAGVHNTRVGILHPRATPQVCHVTYDTCNNRSSTCNTNSGGTCAPLMWPRPSTQQVSWPSISLSGIHSQTVPDGSVCNTQTSASLCHQAVSITDCRRSPCSSQGKVAWTHSANPAVGNHGECNHGCKRRHDNLNSDPAWLELQLKKYKADHEDTLKAVERKEAEMKILHDAYQEKVTVEREQREAIQRELDELKASNTELVQNIKRKESEMKILHDSYQLQMDLERKKREELEKEIVNLKDRLGIIAKVPQVKQEPL